MSRQEFLDELRNALQGKIKQSRINEHIKYYDNYIMEESRKGRTEQQVIAELGTPRLIAKTLIDTEGIWQEQYDNQKDFDYEQEITGEEKSFFGKKYGKILLIIALIVIIILVGRLIIFLLPTILLGSFLFWLIRWMNRK